MYDTITIMGFADVKRELLRICDQHPEERGASRTTGYCSYFAGTDATIDPAMPICIVGRWLSLHPHALDDTEFVHTVSENPQWPSIIKAQGSHPQYESEGFDWQRVTAMQLGDVILTPAADWLLTEAQGMQDDTHYEGAPESDVNVSMAENDYRQHRTFRELRPLIEALSLPSTISDSTQEV